MSRTSKRKFPWIPALVLLAGLIFAAPKADAQPEGCYNFGSNWFESTCEDVGRFFTGIWWDVVDLFSPPKRRVREQECAAEIHPEPFFDDWLDRADIHQGDPTDPFISDSEWVEMIEGATEEADDVAHYLAEQRMREVVDDVESSYDERSEANCREAQRVYDEVSAASSLLEDMITPVPILDILKTIELEAPAGHPILDVVARARAEIEPASDWFHLADQMLAEIGREESRICQELSNQRSNDWKEYPDGLALAVQQTGEYLWEMQSEMEAILHLIDVSPFYEEDYLGWLCDLEWWVVEAMVLHEMSGGTDIDWSDLPDFGSCEGEPHGAGIAVAGSAAPPREDIRIIVQLGDSYSAGFGALPFRARELRPGEGFCNSPLYVNREVTPGFRLLQEMDHFVRFAFEACGGAEVYRSGNRDLRDQWQAVKSQLPELTETEGEGAIIVFTFGGNDVRTRRGWTWVKLVKECILKDCLETPFWNEIENLEELRSEYVLHLLEIVQDVPKATIRVLGYPHLLQPVLVDRFGTPGGESNETAPRHCPGMSGVSTAEARFLDGQTDLLINTLQAAVEEAAGSTFINMSFVDVRERFRGWGACRGNQWDRFVHDVEWYDWPWTAHADSLHPTERGWNAYYEAFLESLGY